MKKLIFSLTMLRLHPRLPSLFYIFLMVGGSGLTNVVPAQITMETLRHALDTAKNPEVLTRVHNMVAFRLMYQSTDSALTYANRALTISKESGFAVGEAASLGTLGMIYDVSGSTEQGIRYTLSSLEIKKELNDSNGLSRGYGNLAVMYETLGKYEEAIANHILSINMDGGKMGGSSKGYALVNIGQLYWRQGDFEKAESYYRESLDFSLEKDLKEIRPVIYVNLGELFLEQGELIRAKPYLDSALILYRKVENGQGEGATLNALARISAKEGRVEEALDLFERSRKLYPDIGQNLGLMENYAFSSRALRARGQSRKALQYARKALEIAQSNDAQTVYPLCYEELALAWRAMGNADSTYHYFKFREVIRDSLFGVEKSERIADLEANYLAEKRKNELLSLGREKEAQDLKLSQSRFWNYLIGGLGLVVLLLLIIVWLSFSRQRIKSRQRTIELEQKMLRSQMNPHFLFNSLNSIQSFILLSQPNEAAEYLGQFAALMRQILENSRDELIPLARELAFLENYLSLQSLRYENSFQSEIRIEGLDPHNCLIPPMLAQPFIENAIEHAFQDMDEKNGRVWITFSLVKERFILEVRDNGMGIAHSKQRKQGELRTHRSLALKVNQERIEMLNKRGIPVSFSIRDLGQEGGERGTLVHFSFPFLPAW